MISRILVAGLCGALTAGATAARAQQGALDPQCGASDLVSRTTQDACQKSVDLFGFLAPQLGTALVGGNAVLGQGGTLGGPGRFTIGIRGNVLRGAIPDLGDVTIATTGAQSSAITASDQIVGLPVIDAGVGVFKGLPVGLTNVGGIDLLLSGSYVPNLELDDFRLRTTGSSLKVGLGFRLGVLQETFVVPGLSVTYLRRDLPRVDMLAEVGDDTVGVSGLQVKTDAWRVVASKSFMRLGLALGAGRDRYDSRASAYAIVRTNGVTARPGAVTLGQEITRTNFFADLSLNLPVVRLVGEIGRASGGTVRAPYNSFGDQEAGRAVTYASAGIRLAF